MRVAAGEGYKVGGCSDCGFPGPVWVVRLEAASNMDVVVRLCEECIRELAAYSECSIDTRTPPKP